MDSDIVANIRDFLNDPLIKTKGGNNLLTQHAKDAIWCAMSGPNISPYSLRQRMDFQDRKAAKRGAWLRSQNFRFDMLRQYKTRKDCVKQETAETIYMYLHDHDVVKDDSNCCSMYTCKNPFNGYKKEKHSKTILRDAGDFENAYQTLLPQIIINIFRSACASATLTSMRETYLPSAVKD